MRIARCMISLALLALAAAPVQAEKRYGPGASDTEIKLGQTVSYSGKLSVFGTIGRVEAAYWTIKIEQAVAEETDLPLAFELRERRSSRWKKAPLSLDC